MIALQQSLQIAIGQVTQQAAMVRETPRPDSLSPAVRAAKRTRPDHRVEDGTAPPADECGLRVIGTIRREYLDRAH